MRKAMYLMGVLDDMDIEWLATHGSGLLAPRGKTLVREGQVLDSVFVLLDGELAVTTGSKQIATLYAGEVVGGNFIRRFASAAGDGDGLCRFAVAGGGQGSPGAEDGHGQEVCGEFLSCDCDFSGGPVAVDDGAIGVRRGQGATGGSAGGR